VTLISTDKNAHTSTHTQTCALGEIRTSKQQSWNTKYRESITKLGIREINQVILKAKLTTRMAARAADTLCNVMGGSVHDRPLLHTNIQHYSSVQLPALQAHRTVPQWTVPRYSTCSTAVHFNMTVSGKLQHTTLDRTSQRSVFLASPETTALEVQLSSLTISRVSRKVPPAGLSLELFRYQLPDRSVR
jgi:hypothetical protein